MGNTITVQTFKIILIIDMHFEVCKKIPYKLTSFSQNNMKFMSIDILFMKTSHSQVTFDL